MVKLSQPHHAWIKALLSYLDFYSKFQQNQSKIEEVSVLGWVRYESRVIGVVNGQGGLGDWIKKQNHSPSSLFKQGTTKIFSTPAQSVEKLLMRKFCPCIDNGQRYMTTPAMLNYNRGQKYLRGIRGIRELSRPDLFSVESLVPA